MLVQTRSRKLQIEIQILNDNCFVHIKDHHHHHHIVGSPPNVYCITNISNIIC